MIASVARFTGALDPQGPNAERADDLFWMMTILGSAVFVLFAVLLAIGLGRRRHEEVSADDEIEQAAKARTWLVGGGVVLPAVVVVVVLVTTIATMRASADEVDDEAVVIDVIGHQWWWEIRYPDLGIETANEIHIPAGEPVLVRLRSADVIHSFWVPALAGKLDLLPERTNELVIEADEPGRYNGKCAEFCGLQHANMGMFVVAESRSDFDTWVSETQEPATAPDGEAAAIGAEVFTATGCGDCHAIDGTAANGDKGPDLTHLASRRTLAAGTLRLTTENLASFVADPHDAKTGISMPPAELADDDLDALVAYLESLE